MKKAKINLFFLFAALIGLNSCCMFKKGSWAPFPSCKNAEESAKKEKAAKEKSSTTMGKKKDKTD